MRDLTYVGNEDIQSVDALDRVLGNTRYVCDMTVPDMLYASVLRSPAPHARIENLDVSSALAMPGVLAVVTQKDFVDHGNFGWPVRDDYVLAYRKVRYVGEPVAVVAAETESAAQAGVEAIILELVELPVVSDVTHALDDDVPLIPEVSPTGQGNLCESHILRNGDPDPMLAECPIVFSATYETPAQEHAALETAGVLAIPEADGGVTLYANNQSPFINRDTVAAVLGLREEQVRSIQPPVGGAFGGKDEVLYETSAQVAKLALLTGRPVRLIFSRSESMIASYKRQATRIQLTLGTNEKGDLQAAKARVLVDNGAYAAGTPLASWRATMHAAGAYRYEAVHVDTQVVYTNNGYAGAFRGFGNTAATAVVEIAIDELAHRLNRDPLAFRLQNCLRTGDRTMTGDPIEHAVGLAECLTWVQEHSEWDRKRATYDAQPQYSLRRRGIGVAAYFHGCGLGGEGEDFAYATLNVEADYGIRLTSGLTDYGQGSRTVFTLLAAEVLGVEMARLHMPRPDTYTTVDSGPTVASRASIVGGNAVRLAAEKLDHELRLAAADMCGCAPAQIVRSGESYIGPDEEPHTFEEIVDHARWLGFQLATEARWQIPSIEWDFERGTGEPYFAYVFGAQVAEVEVNRRTGRAKVTGIWAAHDAGTILFPNGARGQMYGAIAQGLGFALLENFNYEQGIPQKTSLRTYRVPRAMDLPEIEGTFIQTTLNEGPFGAKNMAEPLMVGTAPAIANAVFHATGVRVRRLPIDPEELKISIQ